MFYGSAVMEDRPEKLCENCNREFIGTKSICWDCEQDNQNNEEIEFGEIDEE